MILLYMCVFLLHIYYITGGGYFRERTKLTREILKDYDKRVRGTTGEDTPTEIYIQSYLINILNYHDIEGRLTFGMYFGIHWIDERIRWNATESGMDFLTFKETDVWVPVIVLIFTASEVKKFGHEWVLVRYRSDGYATWTVGHVFDASCPMDVTKYPFDTQVCVIPFSPYGYHSSEIKFTMETDNVNLDFYTEHSTWELINSKTYLLTIPYTPERYNLEITLRRRPSFFIINIILPIMTLGILNLFVFLLPPESGERVGYSITVLLALAFFLTVAFENLPKVSTPGIPVLCIKMLADIVICTFIMLFTIITLRIYNKENDEIPGFLQTLSRRILCRKEKKQESKGTKKYKEWMQLYLHDEAVHVFEQPMFGSCQSVTWTDVGKAFDILFCLLSFMLLLASNVILLVYM